MQSVYEHITLDVTGMNETDNFLLANQLSTRTYLNLTPLLMALLIMSIMKSVFFLEYSLIRSCKDSFSLRFL